MTAQSILTDELIKSEKAVKRAQDAVHRNEVDAIGLANALAAATVERDAVEVALRLVAGK